ncbi:MAG: glycosyltransferase family 4 protein [Acidimicrobiales bacterium]
MKVAVYDQWWPTAGGGEKFAGGIAEVLSADHDVTLLAHEPVDTEALGERLQLDLSRVGVEIIDLGQGAVEEASGDVDLFVNASYTSVATNRAAHGLYVVHFPTPPPPEGDDLRSRAKRWLRPLVAAPGVGVSYVRGFHPEEMIGDHRVRWTTGDARVDVGVPAGHETEVVVLLGRMVGHGLPPVKVRIEADGRFVASLVIEAPRSRVDRRMVVPVTVPVVGRDDGEPVSIRIVSDHHVPADVFGTGDARRLGVPVVGVQVGGDLKAILRRRYPSIAGPPPGFDWVASYDRVVANSAYTREWIRRWWQIDTGVLNPPVTLQHRGDKDKIILNVGRFFEPKHGHSKKQLELVRAMRALEWRGRMPDWTLHLVGGCSDVDRPYLDKVRAEAEGLPVVLHVDAPGAEVKDLYARASIYWHATGLGEDPDTQPDRFEHFGITTVEAMSAGAVPVVIRAAGQEEVVEHGVSGLHWEPLVQLVCFTEDVVLDPDRWAALSAGAEARAEQYGMEAFGEKLRGLVARITATDHLETEEP